MIAHLIGASVNCSQHTIWLMISYLPTFTLNISLIFYSRQVILTYSFPLFFQNMRPSAEDLPEDLALIVTSCWKEDPNTRPNFSQIIQMLLHYLSTISPPEPMVPPRVFTSENAVLPPESPGTSSLMAVRDGSGETPKTSMETNPRGCFSCFNHCYWSPEEQGLFFGGIQVTVREKHNELHSLKYYKTTS